MYCTKAMLRAPAGRDVGVRLQCYYQPSPTDVEAAITGVLRRLPRNMPNPPFLRKNDPSQQPIQQPQQKADKRNSGNQYEVRDGRLLRVEVVHLCGTFLPFIGKSRRRSEVLTGFPLSIRPAGF